jgi:hypothetical protein
MNNQFDELTTKQHNNNESKSMNNEFDELTKAMAQSGTRRAALKKFGIGLGAMALACFGLARKTEAGSHNRSCFNQCMHDCVDHLMSQGYSKEGATTYCENPCAVACSFY